MSGQGAATLENLSWSALWKVASEMNVLVLREILLNYSCKSISAYIGEHFLQKLKPSVPKPL